MFKFISQIKAYWQAKKDVQELKRKAKHRAKTVDNLFSMMTNTYAGTPLYAELLDDIIVAVHTNDLEQLRSYKKQLETGEKVPKYAKLEPTCSCECGTIQNPKYIGMVCNLCETKVEPILK